LKSDQIKYGFFFSEIIFEWFIGCIIKFKATSEYFFTTERPPTNNKHIEENGVISFSEKNIFCKISNCKTILKIFSAKNEVLNK